MTHDPPPPWGSIGYGAPGAAAQHLARRDILQERIRGELAGNPSLPRSDLEKDTDPSVWRLHNQQVKNA